MTTGVREGASTALKIEPPPGRQAAYYSYFVKQNIISRIVQLPSFFHCKQGSNYSNLYSSLVSGGGRVTQVTEDRVKSIRKVCMKFL